MKKTLAVLLAGILGTISLSALATAQNDANRHELQMENLSGYDPNASIVNVETPIASMGTFIGDQWHQWPIAQDVAIRREEALQQASGMHIGLSEFHQGR